MMKNYLYIIPYIIHIINVFFHLKIIKQNKTENKIPLKDIIMDNGPDLSNIQNIIHPLLIIFFIPYMSKNYIYLLDFLKIFSIIVGLRVITSSVTEIPSSNINCNTNITFQSYITGHCFDKIFRGHTSFTLLLVLIAYNNNCINFNKYLILQFLQIIYSIILIFTKGHYSVDVILSYIIVLPIYLLLKDNLN